MAKEDIALRLSLIDGVSRSIADIRKNVNDLGASIVKVNAAAELTGKAFDAIKTAGGFLADQVTSVGNFEQSLAALQAVTGASAEELDRLKTQPSPHRRRLYSAAPRRLMGSRNWRAPATPHQMRSLRLILCLLLRRAAT